MDTTFLNILSFILMTVFYYNVLKPKLTMDILNDSEAYKKYNQTIYLNLGIYFLLIMLLQFGINTSAIVSKCGGSVSKNIGAAAIMTFLPWFLIFGFMIIILVSFPGFKSAFSDVVGYFYVSSKANSVLSDLLLDTNVNNKIQQIDETLPTNPTTPTLVQSGGADKKALQEAADAIIKLAGNMSIIINQIVPGNFLQYIEILKPLMKPQYESNPTLLKEKSQELLDVVIARDNIGEAFWYIYTAILLISITQYNIASRPCSKDLDSMQANYKQYLADEDAAIAKQKAQAQPAYTISS
jgi:hypothetical protein